MLCNVVLDQEFDYVNSCYKDETQDTIMKGLFTDYEKFKMWGDTMPFYKNIKKDGVVLSQVV